MSGRTTIGMQCCCPRVMIVESGNVLVYRKNLSLTRVSEKLVQKDVAECFTGTTTYARHV